MELNQKQRHMELEPKAHDMNPKQSYAKARRRICDNITGTNWRTLGLEHMALEGKPCKSASLHNFGKIITTVKMHGSNAWKSVIQLNRLVSSREADRATLQLVRGKIFNCPYLLGTRCVLTAKFLTEWSQALRKSGSWLFTDNKTTALLNTILKTKTPPLLSSMWQRWR